MTKSSLLKQLILFTFFSLIYFSSTVGIMNSSDGTQYALTKSIAEKHTISIDDYMYWTYYTDYAIYKNHYYSDREPGQSIIALPFYYLGKTLLPITKYPYNNQEYLGLNPDSKIQILTIISVAAIGAASVSILYLLCLKISLSPLSSFITACVFGLGSLNWKYSSGFYRQPLTTCFLLLSFYKLLDITTVKEKPLKKRIVVFATTLGIALTIDASIVLPTLILIFYFFFKSRHFAKPIQKIIIFLLFFSLPLIGNVFYNLKAFQKPIASPHQFEGNPNFSWEKSPFDNFQSPLLPSFMTNLFSNKPIKPRVIAPIFWNNPTLRNATSAYWATVHPYKGIFTQTPVLFCSFFGLVLLFKKNRELVILTTLIVLSIIIPMAKLNMFYSPNMYDTRFFLPAVPFLLVGFPNIWGKILKIKHRYLKYLLITFTVLLVIVSFYNGWYSNLTNYAPNVTGEHRFSLEQLNNSPNLTKKFAGNFRLLFENTFPNIHNAHIILIYLIIPVSACLLFSQKKIINKNKKCK